MPPARTGPTRAARTACILAAAAVIGCGAEPGEVERTGTAGAGEGPASEASAASPVGRDSAGIEIVTVRLDELPRIVAGETVLSVGSVAGGAGTELHRVRTPFLDDRGRLVVPVAGSDEIRFFEADGSLVEASGSEGDGPGEYRSIGWAAPYLGDSLAVWDDRIERLTVVPLRHEAEASSRRPAVRTVRFSAPGGAAPEPEMGVRRVGAGGARVLARGVFADGTFLTRRGEASAGPGDTTAVLRVPVTWARHDAAGNHLADLVVVPDDEHFLWSDGRSRSVQPLAFGRTSDVEVLGDGLVFARNDGFRVRYLDADGRLVRIGEVRLEPEHVSDAAIAEYRGRNAGSPSSPFRETRRRMLDAMPFPERHPFHGDLLVAEDGAVLLERYAPPGANEREWILFRDGVPTIRIALPATFRLTQLRGDRAVGITSDDLDVERVQVLRLEGLPERR